MQDMNNPAQGSPENVQESPEIRDQQQEQAAVRTQPEGESQFHRPSTAGAEQETQQRQGRVIACYCRVCGMGLTKEEARHMQGSIYCAQHAPQNAYGPTQSSYGPTQSSYGPTQSSYGPSQSSYGPTQSSYGSTQASFGSTDAPYGQGTVPPPPPGGSFEPPSPYATGVPPVTGASPGLAFLLGLIPGVGAVYNAQYVKAIVHVVVLGLLISIVDSNAVNGLEPLFGMLIAIWYFYMPFEAYHTARKRSLGIPVDDFSSLVPLKARTNGFPMGPVVLIGLGVLFLLAQFDLLSIGDVLRFWPLALIGVGSWMLYERMNQKTEPR